MPESVFSIAFKCSVMILRDAQPNLKEGAYVFFVTPKH